MRVSILFFYLLITSYLYSGELTWVKRVPVTGLYTGQYSLFEPQRAQGEDSYSYSKLRGFLKLNYSRKLQSDRSHGYDWKLDVSYSYVSNGVTLTGVLRVDNTSQYDDYVELELPLNTQGYQLTITGVSGTYSALGAGGAGTAVSTPQTSTFIPDDIDLLLELRKERIYTLNPSGTSMEDLSRISFSSSDYKLYWDYQQGAEEYDVEWVFIDKYSPEYAQVLAAESGYTANELSGFTLPFELQEPSRVRVWGNSYQLDKAYAEGLLYFRVRSVSVFADQVSGISDDVRLGKWGYFKHNSLGLYISKFEITPLLEFEPNKTWSYGVVYADDGKSASTLTYYDGSNRGRQNLTYNTSDDVTLVGESKYDKEGRQTVAVIPAPIVGRNLLYQQNFNLASTGNVFDETEIEQAVIAPLSTLSGSAKYFSKDNNFTSDLFRGSIPNAGGYVFSQTIYRNDGSGRIESVGGIGSEFQATGTHATHTYYGSTNVAELKRLFGDNVSDAPQGYRKDMVQDANGQLSVSYYDKRGHVIASALAGDAPTSLRPLEITTTVISTPLNDNNVQLGNSMVSEHTFLNTIPNSTITLSYSLDGFVNQIASQTVVVEGHEIPFGQFCADCIYELEIKVVDQQGVVVGTPVQETISAATACGDPSYTNNSYNVQLGTIGEYRIIKTLTVNEDAMIAAFQSQLDAQGSSAYDAFLASYLSTVDLSACITDCEDYCYYMVRQQYIQDKSLAAWESLTRGQIEALIATCMSVECDLTDLTIDDPIGVDPVDACENQRQRMLHQLSPGGVFYDDPNSWLWTAIGSGYGGYTLLQYQDEANFTSDMALALLPLHREACMLQTGKCDGWMQAQNTSLDMTLLIMNTAWPTSASGVFAAPYSSDASSNVFGIGSALTAAVNSYLTNNSTPITSVLVNNLSCSGATGTPTPSIDGNNLFDYVNFYGDRLVALELCNGHSMTADDVKSFKKQLFLGLYLKIKWDLIRSNIGCPLFDDENAVYMIPANLGTMQSIINDALVSVSSSTNCEQTGVNNVNHWLGQLSPDCMAALGMSSFTSIAYPSAEASALQTAYTSNASNPSIAQMMYNYTMSTCTSSTNANTFGMFYDPGVGQAGKTWYDAIKAALANTACGYTVGFLPFEVSTPVVSQGSGATPIVNMNNFEQALNELVEAVMACSTCTDVVMDNFYSDGALVRELNNVSLSNGFSGSIRYARPNYANMGNWGAHANFKHQIEFRLEYNTCVFETQNFVIASPTSNEYNDLFSPVSPSFYDPTVYFFETNGISDLHFNAQYNGTVYWINNNYGWWGFGSWGSSLSSTPVTMLRSGCSEFADNGLGGVIGSILPSLEEFGSSQTDDCIASQIAQAEADAQVLYNQVIENLWSDFYEKMKLCLNVGEDFRMSYSLKEYQYTLYYYDLAGNLVQTVPPQGVHPFGQAEIEYCLLSTNTPSFPAHDMETRYAYNGLNVLVKSYTPDGGRTDLYVDKLYRVRYSENAVQSASLKASYMKYDELGRVIEAGEFKKPVGDVLAGKTNEAAYPTSGILDYIHTFYESGYLPPSSTTNTYPSTATADASLVGQFPSGQENLRNAIGAVMHRQADYDANGNVILATQVITVQSYSYDVHKNVKRMVSTNYQLSTLGHQHKVIDYVYDLISGNMEEVHYQKYSLDEYRYRYHYDANNRLVRSFTTHNGDYWEQDAKYFYYLHGPLARRELGHDQVQGTDYAYTFQGWLKGVNSTTLERTRDIGQDGVTGADNQFFGMDVMGYSLGYFTGDYQAIKDAAEVGPNYLNDYFASTAAVTAQNQNPDAANDSMRSLYNGNITHMVTAIRNLTEDRLDILANNYQYDQLQRIRQMKVYSSTNLVANNDFTGAALYRESGSESAYQEDYTFDRNGNLKSLKRNGSKLKPDGVTATTLPMDNFTYVYKTQTSSTVTDPTTMNRLSHVSDGVVTNDYDGDISSGQALNNYVYNAIGQLVADVQEQIQSIEWTVTGKVKKITYTTAGKTAGKRNVKFIYDPMDRRVAKMVYTNVDSSRIDWTYYSFDASGNVIATYTRMSAYNNTVSGFNYYSDVLKLQDHFIYGAERLGTEAEWIGLIGKSYKQATANTSKNVELRVNWVINPPNMSLLPVDYTNRKVNDKRYELSNHLGNVLAVITDRKVRKTDNGTLVYVADVVSFSDYSPYGVMLDNRHGEAAGVNYRFGFNSMEKDDELKGSGNSYTTEFRQYDPRLGRWLSVDPMASDAPGWTPYRAFFNNPILYTDPSGLYETKREARQARRGAMDHGYAWGKIKGTKGNYTFNSYKKNDSEIEITCFSTKMYSIKKGEYKGGIEFFDAADARGAVPAGGDHGQESFKIGMYTLVPSYVNGKLDYYVASTTVRDPANPSQETVRFDYIIGRDMLYHFEENYNPYSWASILAFEQGAKLHLDQWQIDFANQNYGSALGGKLKKEWSNPINVLDAITSIAGYKPKTSVNAPTPTKPHFSAKQIRKMSEKRLRQSRKK
jgi:RHS repeat-associated protein